MSILKIQEREKERGRSTLYVNDKVSTVVTPVKATADFKKVDVEAGKQKRVKRKSQ